MRRLRPRCGPALGVREQRGAAPPAPGLGRERPRSAAGGAQRSAAPTGGGRERRAREPPPGGRSAPRAPPRQRPRSALPGAPPGPRSHGASLGEARGRRACRPVRCAAGAARLSAARPAGQRQKSAGTHRGRGESPGSAAARALPAGRELRGRGADSAEAARGPGAPLPSASLAMRGRAISAEPKRVRESPSLTRWSSEWRVVGGSYISRSF